LNTIIYGWIDQVDMDVKIIQDLSGFHHDKNLKNSILHLKLGGL
jgi:hypothetical protein